MTVVIDGINSLSPTAAAKGEVDIYCQLPICSCHMKLSFCQSFFFLLLFFFYQGEIFWRSEKLYFKKKNQFWWWGGEAPATCYKKKDIKNPRNLYYMT